MPRKKRTTYPMSFKIKVVKCYKTHPDIPLAACARMFNVSATSLHKWAEGGKSCPAIVVDVPEVSATPLPDVAPPLKLVSEVATDPADEIARLKGELKTKQDALDLLKRVINLLAKE